MSGDAHDFNNMETRALIKSPPRKGRQGAEGKIIDQIHELILEDCRILAKSIAEQLGISRQWVGSIIHEDLDMQKLLHQTTQKLKDKIFMKIYTEFILKTDKLWRKLNHTFCPVHLFCESYSFWQN